MTSRRGVAVAAAVLVASGCTTSPQAGEPRSPARPSVQPTASASPSAPSVSPAPSPSGDDGERHPVRPADFEPGRALAVVRHLAGTIGPRHGTSAAFGRAADWVAARFARLGYRVERQRLEVPGGVSWGVPVDAGRSTNVVATPRGFDPSRPHLVVGAHLDTVPQAPGAEDNGSGVGVLLAAARAAAAAETRLPVVWVAFGAEEPRGPTDEDHHYGSRAYVARMTGPQRRALRGMVSLDRVGVGSVVPVCIGGLEPPTIRRELLRTAGRMDIPAFPCENQASDHWSFDKAGLPAARIGSTPYAEYHSAADRPRVVEPRQLTRVGRLMWEWLNSA